MHRLCRPRAERGKGTGVALRKPLLSNTLAITAPRASIDRAFVGSWAVPAAVLLVAAVSPFERPLGGLPIAGFTLTSLELALAAALAIGAISIARDPSSFEWRTPITVPALALLACVFASSVVAPEFRGNSLRVAGRLTAALLLFTLVANGVSTVRLGRSVVAVLLGAAAIVGGIAVLELAQVPSVLSGLQLFRPGFHVVGGQLRATSTMFYPTITSMYLEVVFALGLAWIASSRIAFGALVLAGAGIIATFTRAGLITMALSLVIYGAIVYAKRPPSPRLRQGFGGLRRPRPRSDGELERLAALAVVLMILVAISRSPQMLVTRMGTEVSQDWYGASYDVPQTLTLRPDSFSDVPVTLSNRGWLTWQSSELPVFALSYHWLSADTEEVVIYDGLRTPFTHPVEPGEDVRLLARVRAPGYPGTYVLVWDVVQEHRTWLSLEGVYPARTIATVEGEAVTGPLPARGRMPSSVLRMPRSVLWQTALRISREHPVLGIGPDNYRHTYGRVLGLAAWDTRVHANNTYLEVLVGTGVVGLLALGWLMAAAWRSSLLQFVRVDEDRLPLFAASAAACLAIAVHGLVDSFWTFTPAYVVFAIAGGLLFSRGAAKC